MECLIELIDGGTAAFDYLDYLAYRDKVIIIDAVKGGNEPGTLYRFTPADITIQSQNLTRPAQESPHPLGVG
ncbi:hydrogenase maturation protease [Dehalococcoidales bacterium]|nr:hydrogenase maturation protease [Dehalococcoidales bacterium]